MARGKEGVIRIEAILAFAAMLAIPLHGNKFVICLEGVEWIPADKIPMSTSVHIHNLLCHVAAEKAGYTIHVVYSLCGNNRKEELLRSLDSLLLLISSENSASTSPSILYKIHIIQDGSVTTGDFSSLQPHNLCYELHKPTPKAAPLFAPCSTQRLYLHEHSGFSDVHQAVYLDIDTLWMDSPKKVIEELDEMEEHQQLFGMAVETSDRNSNGSWYRGGFSKDLPFYGQYGLNAGVLLLNLKALRQSSFTQERDKILKHFHPKGALPLGDQDVLNAYASKYPACFHVMPCRLNFRSDSACYDGFPAILHGNRDLKNSVNSTYSTLYKLFGKVSFKSKGSMS